MRLVFDRGTIVLLDPPSPNVGQQCALADLPGALWDERIRALRCPARFHQALVADLRQRRVRFADEVADFQTLPFPATAPVQLRPYQEAALAAWELADRRGTAVLPTGSGKT